MIRIMANFVSFPNFRYHGIESVENFFAGHVGTAWEHMRAKSKVQILSHFEAVGI